MPVFKYAMKRTFTSISIYVIFLIFLFIPVGVLGFARLDYSATLDAWRTIGNFVTTFFVAFFIGTLISKNISEEIVDGSFLLIVSKPLSRVRILTEKMLAIFIVMIGAYLIVSFLPLLTFLKQRDGTSISRSKFFETFWPMFWKNFAIGILLQFFIFHLFAIFSWYFSPKLVMTSISLFVTFFIILDTILFFMTKFGIAEWMLEIYIYLPIIIVTLALLPINWFVFLTRDFT